MRIIVNLVLLVMFPVMSIAQSIIQYTVKQEDTMASIAAQYGITEEDLKRANPENAELLFPGLLLNIPHANKKNEVVTPVNDRSVKYDLILINDSSFIECKVDKIVKDIVLLRQDGSDDVMKLSTKEILSINYADGTIKKFNNTVRRKKRK